MIGFRETEKQRLYAEAVFSGNFRHLYYGGAIRGGKSYCVMAVIFALCAVFPGSRWVIVRKDLPTIRRTLVPVFNKLRPLDWCTTINLSTWTATCKNGSQIIFLAESLSEDPSYNRWRGLEANGFWLEEANELALGTYHKAIERSGSWIIPPSPDFPTPKQPLPYIFLTSNPAGNWVKREFYEPWKRGDLKAHQFYLPATPRDNPYLSKEYLDSLELLPEKDYKIFVLGDWDELSGAALEELNEQIHVIPRVTIPDHWLRFGAFDWGYAHPFSFGLYTATAEGQVYKVETIIGRKMQDREMIEYIIDRSKAIEFPATSLAYVVAGHDAFHDVKARSNMGPTTAERFSHAGIPMMNADVSRIAGLKNFREMTAWKKTGEKGSPGDPKFRFFDTPNNRRCYAQLVNMILDEDRPEDVLKVDADEQGQGGDDLYDETRYALQSRARGVVAPESDRQHDDRSPGYDYKRREMKPRHPKLSIPGEDDDLRAGIYQMPRQAFKVPRFFGDQVIGEFDELEEDLA